MADGRWQMADGRWQMADGRWQMADGRWQMADGRWQMADGRWQMEKGKQARLLRGGCQPFRRAALALRRTQGLSMGASPGRLGYVNTMPLHSDWTNDRSFALLQEAEQ